MTEFVHKGGTVPSQSTTNDMQLFSILFSSKDTLRVSGGSSAHLQEHRTVHTASGICQTLAATCCYRGRDGISNGTIHCVNLLQGL